MLLTPYRAKNPPERFPYVTVSLIVANVLVYLVTTDHLLVIRDPVAEMYAQSYANFTWWRLITAMFLHGNLMHIVGNMVFLWTFGGALEGRLKHGWFTLLYFASGIVGGLLHNAVLGPGHPTLLGLGASGAIMGVAAAYLFVFPYSTICMFYLFVIRFGVFEVQARWIVLAFIVIDQLEGLMSGQSDGTAHLVHLGGFATGLLFAMALRPRRDSEAISDVQARRSDVRDYSMLSFRELSEVVQLADPDLKAIVAYCRMAIGYPGATYLWQCVEATRRFGGRLAGEADPQTVADIFLWIPAQAGGPQLAHCLRLASRLESAGLSETAAHVYYRVYERDTAAPETETALYRLARLMGGPLRNDAQARVYYMELLRLFPHSHMAIEVRRALQTRVTPA